jgi:hypothetical protein
MSLKKKSNNIKPRPTSNSNNLMLTTTTTYLSPSSKSKLLPVTLVPFRPNPNCDRLHVHFATNLITGPALRRCGAKCLGNNASNTFV